MSRRRSNMSPRGAGVFLLIFGAFWLFGGFMMTKQYNENEAKKKICTQSTNAVITNVDVRTETYRSNKRTKHRTVYYATFEYEVNGNKYYGSEKYQNSVSTGSGISIYYNPDNPSEFITGRTVSGQGSLKTIALVVKIIGGLIGAGGLFMFITGKQIGSRRY